MGFKDKDAAPTLAVWLIIETQIEYSLDIHLWPFIYLLPRRIITYFNQESKKIKMATHGGKREGGGRKLGAVQKVTNQAREEAAKTGLLPHEWLLKVARGEPIEQTFWKDELDARGNFKGKKLVTEEVYPSLEMRADSAKAAAPYYAPRLATQVITLRGREDLLNSMTDDQLEKAISELSAADQEAVKKNRRAKISPIPGVAMKGGAK